MTATFVHAQGWIQFDVHGLATQFWNNTIDGLAQGGIYALIALGYTLVYGVLKLINFAHSEVFVVGAFATWITFYLLGFRTGATPDLSAVEIILYLAIAGIAAMAVSGATAVALERVAYRPLRNRNAPRLVFLITAIGASFALQQTLKLIFGLNQQPQIRLLQPEPLFKLFGASVTNIHVILVVAAVVLWFVADYFVNKTRLGRGIRAVAQDPDTATLMGVNKERVIIVTFLVGGLLAGAAAMFYMMRIPQGAIYNGGFLLGIKAFAAAVLGGIGNLRGALLGGLVLGLVENYGQSLFGGGWKDVVAFVVLVIVLMFRPTGILGESLGKARV
ncbi:branched-chain amino acid ABC transporter permease [Amycolatopsis acidiphila]|uniref:Branched-chain amino acid ABC transporter permease n=1 Tax=Amycolatopsis acidiphila TaxID=715473 RepID=A0A558AKN8_9PSEU|nr:branched-chain amino acid ABC transporter permease [Amycolatopsis acidiphila]TVT24807.1 branched-chain amino acid ABC transporter permease [Amycolatopsis acidiphila]UIJ62788.1 branched-chain amino acid ABC transporter permease [Amycolatopsis acidiphila]